MSKRVEAAPAQAPEPSGAKGTPSAPGVFMGWVVPIALGVGIGWGIVWAWPHVMHSEARRIVDRFRHDDYEHNENLVAELRALGKDARADLADTYLGIAVDQYADQKVWAGEQLARDPFFDTATLSESVRDASGDEWTKRASAAVLVSVQRKECDPELVLPPLVRWLEDLTVRNHAEPLARAADLLRAGLVPPDWEPKIRGAFLRLADRATRDAATPDGGLEVEDDRGLALVALENLPPDDEIEAALWKAVHDESDDDVPRIAAIRALAHRNAFGDVAPWQRAAQSASVAVRQTVADNLQKTKEAGFDAVLVPLHEDAGEFVRFGSLDTQIERRRPTMLPIFDVLTEDRYEWVRFEAMRAAGVFKDHKEGQPARLGILLRKLAESDSEEDVMGAVLALYMITGRCHGFRPEDVSVHERSVEETALRAFIADAEGRTEAVQKWRGEFGGVAEWTDEDRAKTLEKLLTHKDPENVARAKAELAKLRGK